MQTNFVSQYNLKSNRKISCQIQIPVVILHKCNIHPMKNVICYSVQYVLLQTRYRLKAQQLPE